MKIIITGSLGNISKPLTIKLVQKGHQVTVISSKPEKQKDIEELGAKASIGSLNDVEFLKATFNEADAVYCMIPPNFGEIDQIAYHKRIGNNYAIAIKNSGIKRVVHLSSYGAHLDKGTGFILGSHNVEGILNELQNVALTHLRPGYFYYNLLSFIPMIKQANIMGSNYGGEDKIIMVHPTDIAAAAAEELEILDTDTKVRYVVSDDLTASDAAKVLGLAIDKPDLKWLTFTNEQVADTMKQRGMPAHLITNFIDLGASTHSEVLREDYDKQKQKIMGKINIKEFAKEFANTYNA